MKKVVIRQSTGALSQLAVVVYVQDAYAYARVLQYAAEETVLVACQAVRCVYVELIHSSLFRYQWSERAVLAEPPSWGVKSCQSTLTWPAVGAVVALVEI